MSIPYCSTHHPSMPTHKPGQIQELRREEAYSKTNADLKVHYL